MLGLTAQCGPITEKLIAILDSLRAKQSKFPRLESLRAAIKATANKTKIQELKKRLLEIEDEIGRAMISIMKYGLGFPTSSGTTELLIRISSDGQSQIVIKLRHLEEAYELNDIQTSTLLSTLQEEPKSHASESKSQQLELSGQKLDQLLTSMSRLHEEAKAVEWEQRILDSLSFEELRERESSVKLAHEETLDWVFTNPETHFAEWLARRNGIYWLQGKECISVVYLGILTNTPTGRQRQVYCHEVFIQP